MHLRNSARRGSAATEYLLIVGLVSLGLSGAVYYYAFGDGPVYRYRPGDDASLGGVIGAVTAATDEVAGEVTGRPEGPPSDVLGVR